MRIKQILIRSGVLAAVFLVAVVVISLITNRGAQQSISDMSTATLPRISFQFEGHDVNNIVGYVDDMNITAMRDTVIPLATDGTLTIQLNKHGNDIEDISYEVYTLTGDDQLDKGTGTEKDDTVTLDLRGVLEEAEVQEAAMKVTLLVNKKEVHYYLRIEQPVDLSTKACLDFASDFHENIFNKDMQAWIEAYLEPDSEVADNTSYQTVSIYSDVDHVMWGSLQPAIVGDVNWSIKESNETYTSILAEYQVRCAGEEEGTEETYNVKEFFRISVAGGSIFLLNYNRTMNQMFNGESTDILTDQGISLGITNPDVEYRVNSNGTIVSFVQERELWTYNKKDDELSRVFSFARSEGEDSRDNYNQHAVRILGMDKDGSTTFAVYGYMNNGDHEGEVGVDVFYYDLPKNSVEEKAFIPTNQSFAMAEDELGKLGYYDHNDEILYLLAGGTLYQINLKNHDQEEVVKGLEEGQYKVSDDSHLIAYQSDGELNTAKKLHVLNLNTGNENVIEAGEGECVKPLGFVSNDVVYGLARTDDAGVTVSGEETLPMYVLEIRDRKNEVVKTYEAEGIYISDVEIEENLITLNRATKVGEVYQGTAQDYIANNEQRSESNIVLESFVTEKLETQYRLAYADGISDRAPKLLSPGYVTAKETVTVAFDAKEKTDKYLVFGTGEVAGIYDKASYAIAKADELCGVVITTDQQYVWVRGNRDLSYESGFPAFGIPEGMSSFEACEQQLEQFDGTRVDLSGCSISQVCYLINQGIPVIAMTDASNAILLTGYSESTVTYIDPASGAQNTVGIDDMNAMVAGSGNTFIGYIR